MSVAVPSSPGSSNSSTTGSSCGSSDDGFRLEDLQGKPPISPPTRQPDPEDSIRGPQANFSTTGRALQYKKLMAQGQNFRLQAARERSEFRRKHKKTRKMVDIERISPQARN